MGATLPHMSQEQKIEIKDPRVPRCYLHQPHTLLGSSGGEISQKAFVPLRPEPVGMPGWGLCFRGTGPGVQFPSSPPLLRYSI